MIILYQYWNMTLMWIYQNDILIVIVYFQHTTMIVNIFTLESNLYQQFTITIKINNNDDQMAIMKGKIQSSI